ncbi:MAG: NADH-quinone oxidoreductase subunit J [Proteobacteria bacterium]|nr:MAG: NADH-quinone oxidoreductase subunit J [Pseudomonadota bacterium]
MNFIAETLPLILFYVFCLAAVACAVGVITLKNPVACALSLVLSLLNVAGIFAMQQAYFISAIQILVYAGAIMVLFIFVIMLLSVEAIEHDIPKGRAYWIIPTVMATAFFGLIGTALTMGGPAAKQGAWNLEAIAAGGGNVRVISETMFSDYVPPFLIVGMLLSVAIVGAVVLAKRKVE